MTKFTLGFSCDNAAFGDEYDEYAMEQEIARILRRVAHKVLEEGDHSGQIRDINGNWVGRYMITREDDDEA